jgi:cell division protein FtsX
MNTFFFLLGEILGAMRAKTGALFVVAMLLIFVFLALFSCFFLLGTPAEVDTLDGHTFGEIRAHFSPRVSVEEIQTLYLTIREWEEVRQINYQSPQEGHQMGGAFLIQATNPSRVADLVEKLKSTESISEVEALTNLHESSLPLSASTRIGLLLGLIVSAIGCFVVTHRAFQGLLCSCAGEIRLMRLAGTAEKAILLPLVALGILCGLVATLFFILTVYLLHLAAITHPETLLHAASGLIEASRVRTVSLLGLLLGVVMGGLIGALGASLLGSQRFQIYS